jgi:putative ABC transport system permease protein
MTIWRLVVREIVYRKLNFTLAVLSVATAADSVVGVWSLLGLYDEQTEALVAARERQTEQQMRDRQRQTEKETHDRQQRTEKEMRELEDEYRKITKDLGFNLYILHKQQDLAEFHQKHYATHYLPDDYGDKLAKAKVVTVNHLLPVLHEYILWPEKSIDVHLIGTRGEIPIVGQPSKKPIRDMVRPGTIVLGHGLQKQLNHPKAGDTLVLCGEEFTVRKGDTPRGDFEDWAVWLNLADAQRILDKKGFINVIKALECDCQADRLDQIRAEIAAILPNTQVVEKSVMAEGRARARNQARATAAAAIERSQAEGAAAIAKVKADGSADIALLRADRSQLRDGRVALARVLVPLVLLASTLGLGLSLFSNVRERRGEIGVLRAVGVSSAGVAKLVLSRALCIGLLGSILGEAVGVLATLAWAEGSGEEVAASLDPVLLGVVLLGGSAWCGLASLVPALVAARQDPAVVLCES